MGNLHLRFDEGRAGRVTRVAFSLLLYQRADAYRMRQNIITSWAKLEYRSGPVRSFERNSRKVFGNGGRDTPIHYCLWPTETTV